MCFSHIMGKNDLHQSGWFIYHPYSIFREIMNLNLKIWNSTSGSTYGYIVLWSLLGKIQSSPIRMFYTSSSWEFQEGSEYPARNFKFSLWQQIWLHLYNVFQSHSHIMGKFDLHQSGWSIYHPDLNLMENLNLNSGISNLACDSTYGYICISATLWGNFSFTNQDEPYIILTQFLRRIQIRSQNFKIQPIASVFGILLF
jgi:hypothetical protein